MTDPILSYQSKLTTATTYLRTSACNLMLVLGTLSFLVGGCLGWMTLAFTRAQLWDDDPVDVPATIVASAFSFLILATGLTYLIAAFLVCRRSRRNAEMARIVALVNIAAATLFTLYLCYDEARHPAPAATSVWDFLPAALIFATFITAHAVVATLLTKVLREP